MSNETEMLNIGDIEWESYRFREIEDDDIFWFKHYKRLARYADIINALDKGTDTVENLAKKNNITTRTVFRLKRQFVDGEIDLQTLNDFSIIFNK